MPSLSDRPVATSLGASRAIAELEDRHEELLSRIDELNEEILLALGTATSSASQSEAG